MASEGADPIVEYWIDQLVKARSPGFRRVTEVFRPQPLICIEIMEAILKAERNNLALTRYDIAKKVRHHVPGSDTLDLYLRYIETKYGYIATRKEGYHEKGVVLEKNIYSLTEKGKFAYERVIPFLSEFQRRFPLPETPDTY
ncbi:MAG: hypothetical protein ACYCQJ_10740 [Nitrososphaerales archaeon]